MISRENFNKKKTVYCFTSIGEKISIKNDNVIIKDKEGKVKLQTSCFRLFAIYIIGDTSLTTPLVKYSHKFGFSIVLMTSSFRVYDILGFKMEGNFVLREKQYNYKSIDIAKYIIKTKINKQLENLKNLRHKTDEQNLNIKYIKKYSDELSNIEDNIHKIMGIEGICAKLYFETIFNDLNWLGRKPRIKSDYINSTLDIGYTMLFNYIDSILSIYGFDTYKGFLHQQFYMRKSLVCDFVEPFRFIIDWQVRKSINLKQIKEDDFLYLNNRYVLKWKENKKYVQIFSQVINEHKEDIFVFIQLFYRSFMKDKEIEEYYIY